MRTLFARPGNFSAFSFLLLVCMTGCGRDSGVPEYHTLVGEVRGINAQTGRITIAHEDIPGYMNAMTMTFTVRDTNVLRGIEVGDSVRCVLVNRHPGVSIDSLHRTWKIPGS